MPFLDRLDGKPFPAKDMHIVRPTRTRMVDWRSAFVASRDERRERPSEAAVEGLLAAVGQ